MTLGFIGFGEVSSCFAESLMEYDDIKCIAYDKNYEAGCERSKKISSGSVEVVKSLNNIFLKTNIIFVAIPGKYDESLFSEICKYQISDCLFMDLSTALPSVKEKAEKKIISKNAKYVDVAVMGSVPKLMHKTPMFISGNGCNDMVDLFCNFEMDITTCGNEAGRASTIKLCRSIFMKGLPALIIETKKICEKYHVTEEVFTSIYKNMNDQTFDEVSDRLVKAAYIHAVRQRDEVEECLEIIKNVKAEGVMCKATIDIFNKIIEEIDNGK